MRMNISVHFRLLFAGILAIGSLSAWGASQVLATVGALQVTARDLEEALASSPLATAFPTLSEDDQAALRGDMLRRLVNARLLEQEARRLGLHESDAYRRDREAQRLGLLYRAYMDRLRARVRIPPEEEARIRRELAEDPGAWQAARSAYLSRRYEDLRTQTLNSLEDQYHLVVHEDRMGGKKAEDTLLAEGDGIAVRWGDIRRNDGPEEPAEIARLVRDRAQLLLVTRAAEAAGIDPRADLAAYGRERLAALLLARKEAQWIPDDAVLRDYYHAHPEIGTVPEFREIGQLVVASRDEAEALRHRILAGESLYELAGQYSIDPYGRQHRGQMGWLRAGSGMPAIEAALAELPDGQVSEVIETPKGYHLVVIRARKRGRQDPFEVVRDRVRQAYLAERLPAYLAALAERFPVTWEFPIEMRTGTN